MYDSILLATDGSRPAEAGTAWARLLAARSSATVTVARVLPAGHSEHAEREAARQVADTAATIPGARTALLQGDPADALAAEAVESGADVLVMGARGRSTLTGLLLGSTARKLMYSTERPVLVAHEAPGEVRSIVAGVDAGPGAHRVAEAAAGVAGTLGAQVALVNVVDADRELARSPERFGIPTEVWRNALVDHGERVFGPLRPLVPGAVEELRYGDPAHELHAAAEARKAGLVVVARKGASQRDVDAWFSVAFSLAVRGPFAALVV